MFAIPFSIVFVFFLIVNIFYQKTTYYHITHNEFTKVRFNKGLYGEYLTYKYLMRFNGSKLFLFNVYLPKADGKTTEVDALLIHESGLYVFESKNYSGWIFGEENERQWTQVMTKSRTNMEFGFFNPIMQNELHIRWLKILLADYPEIEYHSFIIFSNRCELEKVELTSQKAKVIHLYSVLKQVRNKAKQTGPILNEQRIQEIYDKLYPYSQVTDEVKRRHIENIKKSLISKGKSQQKGHKLCPKCGKVMVLRTATKGSHAGKQFWGCSGFPDCKCLIDENNQ